MEQSVGNDADQEKKGVQMTFTALALVSEIKAFIDDNYGKYTDWYVGIASDPRSRLFFDHNVSEKIGPWIVRDAVTSSEARDAERYFINVIGTDGGDGGGDYTTHYVYAYKKQSYTRP